LAIGQLARQDRHPRLLALLDLLTGPRACLRCPNGQLGDSLRRLGMFIEPQFQAVAHHARHQPYRIARVQPLLGLPLERGIEHAHREHEAGARKDVLGRQLDPLRQQRVVLGEAAYGVEHRLPQADLVRAAGRRRDQVDVGFARHPALGRPADRPGGARADGKVLVSPAGVFLAAEHRRHRLAVELLDQILLHALGETPLAAGAVLDGQCNLQPGQQQCLAAQQTFELRQGER
jgi:hypothetical protein